MAILNGTETSDVLVGTDDADSISGLGGNDTITGGNGNDTLIGGLGADVLDGEGGVDLVSYRTSTTGVAAFLGGARINFGDAVGDVYLNIENLEGSAFGDTLGGDDNANLLSGGEGNDLFLGLGGSDTLIGGLGADTLDGEGGVDLASYRTATAGVAAFLGGARINLGEAVGDVYQSIENLEGSTFADTLGGDDNANMFWGGDGNDLILGAGGSDTLLGGLGADTLDGEGGIDAVSYRTSTVGVAAFLGGARINFGDAVGDVYRSIENLEGSAFADTVGGDDNANMLWGGEGNDLILGLGGSDTLIGGLGADILDGEGGFDFASYEGATSGLTVYIGGGSFNSGEANRDVHTNIVGLIGSDFADILGGNSENNELRGMGGNDWIYGQLGTDTLLGGAGNDVLSGGLGADRLEGGDAIDVAFYRDATTSVTASLLTGGTGGDAAGDTYFNMENIWGSDFNDVLAGDNNAGQVYGFAGNDSLSGLDGDDFFYGGTGFDLITGGAGSDSAFFLSWNDHTNQHGTLEAYEGGDTFTDFTSGTDRIVLSRYWFGFGNISGPTAALTETHANFVTNGTIATSRPSLIWNNTSRTLSFDADGNGATQAVLLGTFQAGATLALSDIWTA